MSDWYWGVRDWPGERLFFVSYLFCVCVLFVSMEKECLKGLIRANIEN